MCFFHQTVNPARRFGLCICCAFSRWKQSYSFLKLHVICWLYTRALKYILIVLGTYSESKGVKYISTSTLLADHGKIRSSAKPKFVAKYGALTICTEISAENFFQMVLVFSSAPITGTGLSCTIYKIQVKFRFLSRWSLALVIQTNGTENFGRFGENGKVIRRKVLLFLRKISTGMNRSIWILPGISGFSIQMVSAHGLHHTWEHSHFACFLFFVLLFIFLPLLSFFRSKIIYAYHKRDWSRQKLKLWGLYAGKELFAVLYLFYLYF